MSKYKLVLPVDTVVEIARREYRHIKKSRIKNGYMRLVCAIGVADGAYSVEIEAIK